MFPFARQANHSIFQNNVSLRGRRASDPHLLYGQVIQFHVLNDEMKAGDFPGLHSGGNRLFGCDFHQMGFWIVGEGHVAVGRQAEGIVGSILGAIRAIIDRPGAVQSNFVLVVTCR